MPELISFSRQVALVLGVGRNDDRHLLDDSQSVTGDTQLARVVGEQTDCREPEIDEDLVADPPFSLVGAEAELKVGLDRVVSPLLQLVGLELVEQTDAAPFLRHVEENSALLLGDATECVIELLAAIAAQRVEDISSQAFLVDAHEHVLGPVHLSHHQRHVVLTGQRLAVGDGTELAEFGWHPHRGHTLDQHLGTTAVLDQVGDRDQLDPVLRAVLDQVGNSRHRAVFLHHLADDASGDQPGQLRQVDRGLGLTSALEHAARTSSERKDVARPNNVARALAGVDRNLDGVRPILNGDTGRDPFTSLDRDGESGLVRRLVELGHLLQSERVTTLRRERQADEAARVRGHEVDRLGSRELSGDGQISLVLSIRGVDNHHEAPAANLVDHLLDRSESDARALARRVRRHSSSLPGNSRSTYLAITSASRLTASPGFVFPSVVTSSVCGMRAAATASSVSSAMVSDTPAIASEPFSTQ